MFHETFKDNDDTANTLRTKSPGPQLLHIRTCLKGRIINKNVLNMTNA